MISLDEAEEIIKKEEKYALENGRPQGTWHTYYDHIYNVAKVCKIIASRTKHLDPEKAFMIGLLHDIGKMKETYTGEFHGIAGYNMIINKDPDIAKGCLLHSFVSDEIYDFEKCKKFQRVNDRKQYDFILEYLSKNPMNDYDILLQMADSIGDYRGFISIEDRIDDFLERHNILEKKFSENILKPRIDNKKYFDKLIGQDVYEVLGIE